MDAGDQTILTVASASADAIDALPHPPLTKTALKKQLKQKRLEERKAQRKSAEKERRKKDLERKRREWDEKLASVSEEERVRLVEARKEARKERMGKRAEERELKAERLRRAKEIGQNIVVDLEFADLMSPNEIHSLVQQIMYCYAVNGRCESPAHLWLTGCTGEIDTQLKRLPGYDKWMIEKESRPYLEALQDQKVDLVYLTADADVVLDELDPKCVYIVGGLVDRNRWKGITLKKAQEQGIQSAKLPIGSYLKMLSSQAEKQQTDGIYLDTVIKVIGQMINVEPREVVGLRNGISEVLPNWTIIFEVLTVNQVVEILLKFLETKDWKTAFFQVIPQRKRFEADVENGEQTQVTTEIDTGKNCGETEEYEKESEKDNKEEEQSDGDEGEEDKRDSKKKRIESIVN